MKKNGLNLRFLSKKERSGADEGGQSVHMTARPAFVLLCAALVIGLALFTVWLNRVDKVPLISRAGQTFEKARVTAILQDNLMSDNTRVGEQVVEVEVLTGEKKGEVLTVTSSSGYLFGAPCTPGMRVILMQSVAGETVIASVYAKDREWVIYAFGFLYLAALVVIGGKQGIKGGLLFSGLLISSLGAVLDVAMSIASSMSEILAQNPSLSRRKLFAAGIRVGRDMMGTDSNTLILAFAGSSVSMLLLDYSYSLPYQQIINSNNIGIAVMQGLAGSFGVVLSVPITVLAGAAFFKRNG